MITYKNHDIYEDGLIKTKSKFKDVLSRTSWVAMEEAGITFTLDGVERTMIVGSKWGRVAMHSNLLTIRDDEIIMWKFKDHKWSNVSKNDLYAMHVICNRHIAESARWEYILNKEIDNANTEEELQEIADKATFTQTIKYAITNGEVHES